MQKFHEAATLKSALMGGGSDAIYGEPQRELLQGMWQSYSRGFYDWYEIALGIPCRTGFGE